MEKQKFEVEWKKVFDEAEISPSDNVWTNIELTLAKAEHGKMKRSLVFYKSLAAASVVIALTFGGASVYFLNQEATMSADIAALNTERIQASESNENNTRVAQNDSRSNSSQAQQQATRQTNSNTYSDNQLGTTNGNSMESPSIVAIPDEQEEDDAGVLLNTQNSGNAPQLAVREKRFTANGTYVPAKIKMNLLNEDEEQQSALSPELLLLASLAETKQPEKDKDKTNGERLWTAVGVSAGAFNSANVNSTALVNSTSIPNSNVVNNQSKTAGVVYSAGVNVGTRLSNRWVIQGGVNYLTQSSDYTTNGVVAMENSPATFTDVKNNSKSPDALMAAPEPYQVNNNLRFVSIPVQAGYLIVNKDVGLQVNAGLSTDMFLQNTMTPQRDGLVSETQSRGSESPYRTVNFSGLMGTEISYKFGKNYRLSLNPGLRYPFNSIYKSQIGVSANPLVFDVGLKFRYIFN